MKQIFLLVMLVWSIEETAAQCMVDVPVSPVMMINVAEATITESDGVYWLCNVDHLTIAGNNNTVFVEPALSVTITGNDNTVYSHAAHHAFFGNANIVFTSMNATVVEDPGNENYVTFCDTLVFDHPGMPPEDCLLVTTIVDQEPASVNIYPNPTNGTLFLGSATGTITIQTVALMDAQGRMIRQYRGPLSELDLADVLPGFYVLRVLYNGSFVDIRVNKQ